MDNNTLNKMIELASKGGKTEIDKDTYFKEITVAESINRFRFTLLYNNIEYKEIQIRPKNNEDDHNKIIFFIDMNNYKHIDMKKFAHYEVDIRGEFGNKVCIIFKDQEQSDQEQFLETLRVITDDSDEVNNMIHSYKLFKDTHRYDKYIVQFDNEKLIRINNNYLN